MDRENNRKNYLFFDNVAASFTRRPIVYKCADTDGYLSWINQNMRYKLKIGKNSMLFIALIISTFTASAELGEDSEYLVSPELAKAVGLVKYFSQPHITWEEYGSRFDKIQALEPFLVGNIDGDSPFYCCIYYYGDGEPLTYEEMLNLAGFRNPSGII